MRHPMWLAGALLGLFGIVGSTLVSLTYESTADRIAHNEREALLQLIHALVPADTLDNDLLLDTIVIRAPYELGTAMTTVYRGRRGNEAVAAVFSPVVTQGYNGAIKLIIAVHSDGSLGGVRVLSHKETPGLGDKIEESRSDWILGFSNRSLDDPVESRWKVKRDGGAFDQFTGATITPRAIVTAVKQTLLYFQRNRDSLFEASDSGQAGTPGEQS